MGTTSVRPVPIAQVPKMFQSAQSCRDYISMIRFQDGTALEFFIDATGKKIMLEGATDEQLLQVALTFVKIFQKQETEQQEIKRLINLQK
jgi:hypothetical protein